MQLEEVGLGVADGVEEGGGGGGGEDAEGCVGKG